jgi:replication factor C subunit 2/4
MASFFDIRARQAAAAAAAASSSTKTNAPQENNRLQPWVEK